MENKYPTYENESWRKYEKGRNNHEFSILFLSTFILLISHTNILKLQNKIELMLEKRLTFLAFFQTSASIYKLFKGLSPNLASNI